MWYTKLERQEMKKKFINCGCNYKWLTYIWEHKNCKNCKIKLFSCDNCWENFCNIQTIIKNSRKEIIFLIMDDIDKRKVVNKSIWKNRRQIIHIIRNIFNKSKYISNYKNSLWKYFCIKI